MYDVSLSSSNRLGDSAARTFVETTMSLCGKSEALMIVKDKALAAQATGARGYHNKPHR